MAKPRSGPSANGVTPVKSGPPPDFIEDVDTSFRVMGGVEQSSMQHTQRALLSNSLDPVFHLLEAGRIRNAREATFLADIYAYEQRFLPAPPGADKPDRIPVHRMSMVGRFASYRLAASIAEESGVGRKQLVDVWKGFTGMMKRAFGGKVGSDGDDRGSGYGKELG